MIRVLALLLCFSVLAAVQALPQSSRKDRGVYLEPKNEFLDSIRKETGSFNTKPEVKKKRLRMDFSGMDLPGSVGEFTTLWHTPPVSQGLSGMCWAFSTVSFLESEVHRLTKKDVKLSELYTVYWEYVEKARRFIEERGNSAFAQGSESDAVTRIWKKYGIVPAAAYTGMKPGQRFHDHDAMFREMDGYLKSLKDAQAWNEEAALATIRAILDHHLGTPPAAVTVDGVNMTPQEYLRGVLRLNPDDYVCFLSCAEKPYYRQAEHEVPDNWWHSVEYYNIPLDEYMSILRKAIRRGYTLALGGDTSEPGYEGHAGIGMVPSFDIPSEYIDENARQFRFSNATSTDDHGVHLVGYREKGGADWYLIKDSGSGSRNNSHPGYFFYHQDYVKLKMLDFMVHRSIAEDVLAKFPHGNR